MNLFYPTHSSRKLSTACKVIKQFRKDVKAKRIENLSEDQIKALDHLNQGGAVDDLYEDVKDSIVQTYKEAFDAQRVFPFPNVGMALALIFHPIYKHRTLVPTSDETNIIYGLFDVFGSFLAVLHI